MSIVKYAIGKVFQAIPKEILNLAFLRKSNYLTVPPSLASQINDLVITPIVKVDADVVGGRELLIPLTFCRLERIITSETSSMLVINIPSHKVENRKILQGLSLIYNTSSNISVNARDENVFTNSFGNIMERLGSQYEVSTTANLELISSNTILIREDIDVITDGSIKILIANEDNLSNLSNVSKLPFAEMTVLAVKMFIYKELNLKMDEGYIKSGYQMGKLSATIESYESAYEEYHTFLNDEWSKISFMNDVSAMDDLLKGMIGHH